MCRTEYTDTYIYMYIYMLYVYIRYLSLPSYYSKSTQNADFRTRKIRILQGEAMTYAGSYLVLTETAYQEKNNKVLKMPTWLKSI